MRELRRKLASYVSGPLMSHLLYAIICLLHKSMRIRYIGSEILPSFALRREGFIGVSWHARILMLPFIYPGARVNILISTHRDGEIIANIIKRFGFGLVRGSSSKGGLAALREMVALLKKGDDLGITPDGPKGPKGVVKGGVAQLAKVSGKAVIPIAYSASRVVRSTSWDRMLLPLPFSRLVYIAGEPLYYCDGEELEDFRLRIEHALHDVTAKADGFFTNS